MKEFKNGEATENSLENDANNRGIAEILHVGPLVVAPEEVSEPDDEKAKRGGDEAVGMFERDATDHGRIEGAVRERPIRDGKSGVFGSDESARGEKNHRPSYDE